MDDIGYTDDDVSGEDVTKAVTTATPSLVEKWPQG